MLAGGGSPRETDQMDPEMPSLESWDLPLPTQPDPAGNRRALHEQMDHTDPTEYPKYQELVFSSRWAYRAQLLSYQEATWHTVLQ